MDKSTTTPVHGASTSKLSPDGASKRPYQRTPDGVQFHSERRAGEVRVPNYIYDLWMPLLGAEAIGVYTAYCRLEREDGIRGMTLDTLARAFRIGKARLLDINDKLAKCGMIRLVKPQGQKRLMHYTTEIIVLDPPQKVSDDLIREFGHPQGYEILTPWLCKPESSEVLLGTSGSSIQNHDAVLDRTSKIESSIVESSIRSNFAQTANAVAQTAPDASLLQNVSDSGDDTVVHVIPPISPWYEDKPQKPNTADTPLSSGKSETQQDVLAPPDAAPKNVVPPAPILPPVPDGHEAIWESNGRIDTRHYRQQGKTTCLCHFRGGAMRGAGWTLVPGMVDIQCPHCATLYQTKADKAAAAAKLKKASAFSSTALFDAIGRVYGATDPADVRAIGWKIGRVRAALVTWALDKMGKPDLDEPEIARLVTRLDAFPAWYREACKGCPLPGDMKFMDWWLKYMNDGVPQEGEYRFNADAGRHEQYRGGKWEVWQG